LSGLTNLAVWQMLIKVCSYGSVKMDRCLLLLEETFTVLVQTTRYTLLFFLIVTPKYTFLKVFTSFVKTLYISIFYYKPASKTLNIPPCFYVKVLNSYFSYAHSKFT